MDYFSWFVIFFLLCFFFFFCCFSVAMEDKFFLSNFLRIYRWFLLSLYLPLSNLLDIYCCFSTIVLLFTITIPFWLFEKDFVFSFRFLLCFWLVLLKCLCMCVRVWSRVNKLVKILIFCVFCLTKNREEWERDRNKWMEKRITIID